MTKERLPKDPEGMKISLLTVGGYSHSDNGRYFKCFCDCGEVCIRSYSRLNRAFNTGETMSCGCKVGVWGKYSKQERVLAPRYRAMLSRCYNRSNKSYHNYGGRGIRVCDEWLGTQGFSHFIEDMGYPDEGESLERVDNNGQYCKDNCVWADSKNQVRNTRVTRKVIYKGKEEILVDLCDELGVEIVNVYKYHIHGGMNLDEVIDIDLNPMRYFGGTTHRYVTKDGEKFRVRCNGVRKTFSNLKDAVKYRDKLYEEGKLKPTRRFGGNYE